MNGFLRSSWPGWIDLKPFHMWCCATLPTIFGDEMDYYEVLCKVKYILNGVIKDVELTAQEIDSIKQSIAEINKEIENLSNNISLEIKEEVKEQLNELIESGYFKQILADYVGNWINFTQYCINVEGKDPFDESTDVDTLLDNCIQYTLALNKSTIYFNKGNYTFKRAHILNAGMKLIGCSTLAAVFNIDCTGYFLTVGQSYDYSNFYSEIQSISFNGSATSNFIQLNAGIKIVDCEIRGFSVAVNRVSNYIDMITIERTSIIDCSPGEGYAINLNGNGDNLYIRQAKIGQNSDVSINALSISLCNGAVIEDSILTGNVLITRCKGFTIKNCHFERYPVININSAVVTIENNYKWKNKENVDINVSSDNVSQSVVIVKDNSFLYQYPTDIEPSSMVPILQKDINSIVKLSNNKMFYNQGGTGASYTSYAVEAPYIKTKNIKVGKTSSISTTAIGYPVIWRLNPGNYIFKIFNSPVKDESIYYNTFNLAYTATTAGMRAIYRNGFQEGYLIVYMGLNSGYQYKAVIPCYEGMMSMITNGINFNGINFELGDFTPITGQKISSCYGYGNKLNITADILPESFFGDAGSTAMVDNNYYVSNGAAWIKIN